MTGRQSYILGCDFAIHQLTKNGSEFYVVHEGNQYIQVAWKDILEWLEKEYNKQEPFINKPCVSSEVCEHDKQIVLDKIREQIKSHLRGVEITLEVLAIIDPLRLKMEGAKDTLEECLELIDKAEAEADNG